MRTDIILSLTKPLQITVPESLSAATAHLDYVNSRIALELPPGYQAGATYQTPAYLVRFAKKGWEGLDVTNPSSPLMSIRLDEALLEIDRLSHGGSSWRPMLPIELAALSREYPYLQRHGQILALGYFNYAAAEKRFRAFVLGGGDTQVFGDVDGVDSLFYNLGNYNIGPATFVGIVPKGIYPHEATLLEPYYELLERCRELAQNNSLEP